MMVVPVDDSRAFVLSSEPVLCRNPSTAVSRNVKAQSLPSLRRASGSVSESKRFGSVAAYNVNAQFEWTKRQVQNVHLQPFYGSLRKLGTSPRPPLSRVEIWRCAYYYASSEGFVGDLTAQRLGWLRKR